MTTHKLPLMTKFHVLLEEIKILPFFLIILHVSVMFMQPIWTNAFSRIKRHQNLYFVSLALNSLDFAEPLSDHKRKILPATLMYSERTLRINIIGDSRTVKL